MTRHTPIPMHTGTTDMPHIQCAHMQASCAGIASIRIRAPRGMYTAQTCACTRTRTCTCTRTRSRTRAHTCAHTRSCTHACVCRRMHRCTCAGTHTWHCGSLAGTVFGRYISCLHDVYCMMLQNAMQPRTAAEKAYSMIVMTIGSSARPFLSRKYFQSTLLLSIHRQ